MQTRYEIEKSSRYETRSGASFLMLSWGSSKTAKLNALWKSQVGNLA